MAFSVRRLGRRFFITVNIICCVILLLSLLLPYLNPDTFWFLGFLGIAMPYMVVLVAAFIFFWLVLHWQYMAISVACLLMSYSAIQNLVRFGNHSFALAKAPKSLRVLTWNVGRFGGDKNIAQEDIFASLITRYNPDILCMQEFGIFDKPERKKDDRIVQLMQMGYKHYVLSRDYSRKKYGYSNGLAIFSKYPFANTKRVPYTSSAESILRADIVVHGDTLHVFNSHLQSYQFNAGNYREIDRIQSGEDSLVQASRNIIGKMKRAFRNRGAQARQLEAQLDSVRYAAIICTDMNDVPNSYAYGRIANGRTDAFTKHGYAIGRTFRYLLPTLRIDYIFSDKYLDVQQYEAIPNRLSDHWAVVADLLATDTTAAARTNAGGLTKPK